MATATQTKTATWRLAQAQRYVADHVELVSASPIRTLYTASQLRCIDGRHSGNHQGKIGFPGGSLGAALAALAGIEALEQASGKHTEVTGRGLLLACEEIFQGVSCHSDSHHSDDSLACRGCGHCFGAMAAETREAYALGRFLDEAQAYACDLQDRAKKHDATVWRDVYDLDHREGAVLYVIDDLSREQVITVPGTYGDGNEQAFVFHAVLFEDILHYLVRRLVSRFSAEFEHAGISETAFQEATVAAGTKQLQATAGRLAAGKPTYYVHWHGESVVVSSTDPRVEH